MPPNGDTSAKVGQKVNDVIDWGMKNMPLVGKVKEIYWVTASPEEVYECSTADLSTAPKNWYWREPHRWIILVPDVGSAQTSFAYSRTSDLAIPLDLQEVRMKHAKHLCSGCCVDKDGVMQYAQEERVLVLTEAFMDLVRRKEKISAKLVTKKTCNFEKIDFLESFQKALRSTFSGDWLFRRPTNEY